MNTQKRICVINDISCEGRCSVTAALPIFAAAGIHGNLIPTALLSTQTGGYMDYTFLDLSAEMEKIAAHFKSLDLKFDVLYSGYLAGESQIDTVCKIADMLEAKSFIVDTVMGDGGKLYPGFTKDFCNKMKLLCKRADIITPNLTEACFLMDMDYSRVCEDDIEEITDGLLSLGAKNAVVTGLKNKNGEMGVAAFNGKERYLRFYPEIKGFFHGSGDVFCSALACGIANGKGLIKSAELAQKFTNEAIKITALDGTDTRQGLSFERCLNILVDEYNKN